MWSGKCSKSPTIAAPQSRLLSRIHTRRAEATKKRKAEHYARPLTVTEIGPNPLASALSPLSRGLGVKYRRRPIQPYFGQETYRWNDASASVPFLSVV